MMSHTVTVTRTTTSGSSSAVIVNTGYCKSAPGLLKLAEVILGAVIVATVIYYRKDVGYYLPHHLFFIYIAITFFIGSFLLLLGCLISLSAGSVIAKTSYEFIFHGGAFILYLIATTLLLVNLNDRDFNTTVKPYTIAAGLAVVNTILYAISTFLAYRSYHWL